MFSGTYADVVDWQTHWILVMSPQRSFLGGFALNFKEMPKFRRIVFLVGIFSFLAGTILTFLDVIGPLHGIDWLKDILDCTFWLSIGITFWKKEMIFSIICFALFGLNLYLAFR